MGLLPGVPDGTAQLAEALADGAAALGTDKGGLTVALQQRGQSSPATTGR